MPGTDRTFRIFISSTFDDFIPERNELQKKVFPALRKHCDDYGCSFQAIDLRWGVSRESSLDQKAVRVCLDEIKRCQDITPRPNFLLLLGNRYGWRPLPEEIEKDEFKEILGSFGKEEEEKKEKLEEWYGAEPDRNAITPVYCLKHRSGIFEDDASWGEEEKELRAILIAKASQLGFPKEKMFKYEASATHQEIQKGILEVEDAAKHVFAFLREIPPEDIPKDKEGGAIGKKFIDLVYDKEKDAWVIDEDARKRLRELKALVKGSLPHTNFPYAAGWVGIETGDSPTADKVPSGEDSESEEPRSPVSRSHLEDFCDDVERSLREIIDKEIEKHHWEKEESPDPVKKEVEEQNAFAEDRARFFTGCEEILATINEYIVSGSTHPLGIYGEGGTGKSALMAQAMKLARGDFSNSNPPLPGAEVVYRFIGATAQSTDIRALLENICRQVTKTYQGDTKISTSYEDLVEDFPKRLALATAEKPLILFIDALDQLSSAYNAGNLAWLPRELPESVRMIVTTRHGESLVALEHRLPEENIIELGPMALVDANKLLDSWLQNAGRTLQDFQRKIVLDNFEKTGTPENPGGLPLYLKLAFEEARRWKSYTDIEEKGIKPAPSIKGIIEQLYERLESVHGQVLASHCLSYIAASREGNGFAEDELIDILSEDTYVFDELGKMHKPPEQRLPVALWSRLYFDLEPYLGRRTVESTTLLTFYHRELGEVARKCYLARNRQDMQERHRLLAEYFLEKADPGAVPKGKDREHMWAGTPRALAELPFHQASANMLDDLFKTMTDFVFLEEKAQRVGVGEFEDAEGNKTKVYNGVFALLRDYEESLQMYDAALRLDQGDG